jgi:mannosyltransferase
MGFIQDVAKKMKPSPDIMDKLEDLPRRAEKSSPRLGVFGRRIRLKGGSSISIPLGLVLLFPCLVIGLILVLFMRSPDTSGMLNMPAGTPPSIRYVLLRHKHTVRWADNRTGESAKSTTNHSLWVVSSLK